MIRAIFNFFGFIFTWATLGLLMASLFLIGIFWIYGQDLPDHEQLAQYEPATLSRVYSGRGQVMDEFARERRIYTPVDEIPDLVKQAFISAEDKNFYTHTGFDARGIASAIRDAIVSRGENVRGASTITQQVMKNFLLDGSRSYERKIKEIILATRLEGTLSKGDILGLYLNEIFLGQNSYGVTAAANTYFSKPLEQLTPAEVAYLAALPKAPSTYHPVRAKERAISRRNFVLKEMYENGYLDQDRYAAAREADLITVQSGDIDSLRAELPKRDYFTDEIRRQLSTKLDEGEEELFTGGLTIRATMDPSLQQEAASALRTGLEKYDRSRGVYLGPLAELDFQRMATEDGWREALAEARVPRDIELWQPAVVLLVGENSVRVGIEGVEEDEDGHFITMSDVDWVRSIRAEGFENRRPRNPSDMFRIGDVIMVKALMKDGVFDRWSMRQIPEIQGGFMAMDVKTGRVLAMQGGFSYEHSVFNRATQATRQPGSSFKPFVYAAALDSGYTPASIVVDAPVEVESGGEIWRPTNASDRFYGPAPLRTGIEQSRNLMTVRIAQDVGMDRVADYANRFGVYQNMPLLLSYSLGAGETTLFKMVSAYAMFANGGREVEPTLVDRVQDRYGRTIYRHDQRGCKGCETADFKGDLPLVWDTSEQIMSPVTAYQVASMMRGVVSRGTAKNTIGKVLGVPISGKTGTTNDSKDVWFIGFTPRIVAGCYMGFDTPRPMGKGAFGGTMCGPVFADFMKVALKDHGSYQHPQPPNTTFIKIDRFTGQRLPNNASGENVVTELFHRGDEPAIGGFGVYVDGGFAMAQNIQLFSRGGGAGQVKEVTTSSGQKKVLPTRKGFGTLSSGGLY